MDHVLRNRIRERLGRLQAENGELLFERVCGELARKRIHPNIRMACFTAGHGDGGRDFENIPAAVDLVMGAYGRKHHLTPDTKIVGACSLGRTRPKAKIEHDIKTICAKGPTPDCIYHFLETDFSSAEQIRIRQWCQHEYGIQLEILTGDTIADWLAEPDMAVVAQLLGVPVKPVVFELEPVRLELPPNDHQAPFIPSAEDYEKQRVHRPHVADDIIGHLNDSGRVLVRGVGASGKTVLAWLLALENVRKGWPAYYLNLAALGDNVAAIGGNLENDLLNFGHPRVMFILDNVHLNERLAKRLAVVWQGLDSSLRPRLLLVGREMHSGRGSAIKDLDIPVVALKAQQAEVLGVFRRLALGFIGDNAVPEPPFSVLDDWVRVFGGNPMSPDTTTDLIAFSAAVLKRMFSLLKKNWVLTERDAIEEIRESYLHGLSKKEIRNLMRLASVAELELSLPDKSLDYGSHGYFKSSHQKGLVFKERVGVDQQHTRYRLAHAALGRLLLAAAVKPVDPAKEQSSMALNYPFVGFMLAKRLIDSGQVGRARNILAKLIDEPGSLLSLPNLSYVTLSLRLIEQHLPERLPDASQSLMVAQWRAKLAELALVTPLSELKNFLAYADKTHDLEPVFDALSKELEKEHCLVRLVENSLEAPLIMLRTFLAYAEKTDALKLVFIAFSQKIQERQYCFQLVENALDRSLADLESFLAYAEKTSALNVTFTLFTQELEKDECRIRLVEQALNTPLHFLRNFLAYTEKSKPLTKVFALLTDELKQEKHRVRLVNHALNSPLEVLTGFLAYAEKTTALKALFTALVKEFERPNYRDRLANHAAASRLNSLSNFLLYAQGVSAMRPVFIELINELETEHCVNQLVDTFIETHLNTLSNILEAKASYSLWDKVLNQVNETDWEKRWLSEQAPGIHAFVKFQGLMTKKKRSELAASPALSIVRNIDVKAWHSDVIGIHHLSHTLRCAVQATVKETREFLDTIVTPHWVDAQMAGRASTGGLAGSLFSLSITLPDELRGPFLCSSLEQRIIKELTQLRPEFCGWWAEALSLLGSGTALGLRINAVDADWPSAQNLIDIVQSRRPDANADGIGHMQAQLWFGIREMARLRKDRISLSADHSEKILALWRMTINSEESQGLPNYVREANQQMIGWLEQCQQQEWCLMPESS